MGLWLQQLQKSYANIPEISQGAPAARNIWCVSCSTSFSPSSGLTFAMMMYAMGLVGPNEAEALAAQSVGVWIDRLHGRVLACPRCLRLIRRLHDNRS